MAYLKEPEDAESSDVEIIESSVKIGNHLFTVKSIFTSIYSLYFQA